MWTVIFTCHCWLRAVSWQCLMVNSERLICEIALQQISLHLLLSVQVISQWQGGAGEHKSHIWAVDVTLIPNVSLWSCLGFQLHLQRHTRTLAHIDIHAQMGFHIWMPGAVVLALKTPITSVKHYSWLYWSFSAIMQYGHERWLNMNRMGKEEMMRPLWF